MAAGEPSIEGVFVAQVALAVDVEVFLVDLCGINPVGVVGDVAEGWDRNTPWDLARDIPVAEFLVVVD